MAGVVLDRETGVIGQEIPAESLILTPEDLARQREEKERKKEAAKRREENERNRHRDKKDRFYFVASDIQLNLPPVDAARMIYLATYLDYHTDILTKGYKKDPIKKADLSKILRVSADTVDRFLQAVSPQYLHADDDGNFHVNGDWFFRGWMKKHREFSHYQQFYDYAVRKLYESATTGSLKKIGYVFNMLPWISREWNVLSVNPEEDILDDVQPMSVTEFCEKTGLSQRNIQRTLREIRSIRFKTSRGLERFCSGVDDGAVIVVNPNVLYVGSNINRVKVYDLFFKDVK